MDKVLIDGVDEENKQKSLSILSPVPFLSRLIVVTKDAMLFWGREVRDDKKAVLHPVAPASTAYFLARLTKGETILPHVSTLGQGRDGPAALTLRHMGGAQMIFWKGDN